MISTATTQINAEFKQFGSCGSHDGSPLKSDVDAKGITNCQVKYVAAVQHRCDRLLRLTIGSQLSNTLKEDVQR